MLGSSIHALTYGVIWVFTYTDRLETHTKTLTKPTVTAADCHNVVE
jgi:hypothetical protein